LELVKPLDPDDETELHPSKAVEALRKTRVRLEAAEEQIGRLVGWLDYLRHAIRSLIGSRRWRLGNFLVWALGTAAGLPRNPPIVEKIDETIRAFERWKTSSHFAKWPDADRLDPRLAPLAEIPRTHKYDAVVLANIDWRARFQRPQQVAIQFARHGHRVFYVVGSPPSAPHEDSSFSIESVADNIFEVRPAASDAIDRYGQALDTQNTEKLSTSLGELFRQLRVSTAVLFVHLPFWTPLALLLQKKKSWLLAYDCMDEWDGFPHIGPSQLEAERELVRRADLVTVTAARLQRKWQDIAQCCELVRNGVDAEFFTRTCLPNQILSVERRPVIGFYGALAEWIDYDLIAFVARARSDWTFVLVGDVFVDDLRGLDQLENVQLLGRRPYGDMPRYLYHFDVCMIPFVVSDVTHAVDPVKLYEFLSVGKPVVSVALEELEPYADFLYLAESREEFLERLDEAVLERDPSARRERVEFARRNDWKHRYESIRDAVSAAAPKVSVIVVAYQNEDLTRLCVESVLANTLHPNLELILVDNGSSDGTARYLRHVETGDDRIKVILNDENRGFAAANNQGLALATGDYLVLLNNDTVVPRGWLLPMLRHLADPEIGLVGPTTNFAGNEAKIEVSYDSLDQLTAFAEARMWDHEGRSFDIDMLAMFCLALRRDVFEEVGTLDEDFRVGLFEDDDYSRRVREKGYRIVCAEDAYVHHVGQAAFKQLLSTGEYDEIWNANKEVFEKKWGKWKPHRHRPDA